MARTYHWDFAGPDASGTASHFRIHLDEFLQLHHLHGCETGVTQLAPLRFTAWCKATEEAVGVIQKALRPPRVVET